MSTNKDLKPKFVNAFMNVAKTFANLSFCERAKTGAVIVKDGRIIASGYNGTPSGACNCCEENHGTVTKSNVIHAEANAILSCAKHGVSTDGTIMFCTMSPCPVCALSIVQAGIKIVIYDILYRDPTGIHTLMASGVMVSSSADLLTNDS